MQRFGGRYGASLFTVFVLFFCFGKMNVQNRIVLKRNVSHKSPLHGQGCVFAVYRRIGPYEIIMRVIKLVHKYACFAYASVVLKIKAVPDSYHAV